MIFEAFALTGEVGEIAEIFQWKGDADCPPGLENWKEEDKSKFYQTNKLQFKRQHDICF